VWFKNVQPFVLSEAVPYDPEALSAELACIPWVPCSGAAPETAGFVPPIGGEGAPLAYGAQGFMLFCLKIQKKVLAPAVVRERFEEKLAEIEEKQGRQLFKDEQRRLKEDLHATMLSQSFPMSTKIHAMIDTRTNHLYIDSTTARYVDKMVTLFKQVFPEQTISMHTLISPPAVMTHWLMTNAYPDSVSLADSCVLADGDERQGVVRFTRKDLCSKAVERLLTEGSQVVQLAVNWRGQLQCQIRKDFSFSGIKYSDAVRELAKDHLSETPEQRFASNFLLMAETVTAFVNSLLPAFEEKSAQATKRVEDIKEPA